MASQHSADVADRAKALYETNLRSELEKSHFDEFVAIEPDSGDYFVSPSFSSAVQDARRQHPAKISFVIRVGHPAAVHIGLMAS